MKEAAIEKYLRERASSLGGKAYKWVSPGNNGVPDRVVILPGGRIAFVELKAPGKMSRPQQRVAQIRLMHLGCRVYTDIDDKNKVDALIEELRRGEVI